MMMGLEYFGFRVLECLGVWEDYDEFRVLGLGGIMMMMMMMMMGLGFRVLGFRGLGLR